MLCVFFFEVKATWINILGISLLGIVMLALFPDLLSPALVHLQHPHCHGDYDSCFHAVLQSQQWKFTPKESKHYALKVALQANLDGGTGAVKNSPGKHKAFLSVFGQGVCGEIKVRALD